MKLRKFYRLVNDGGYSDYLRSIRDDFYRENDRLYSGVVVEAGCGRSISYRTGSSVCRYFGIDISISELLENKGVDFRICADVGNLPLRSSSVDLIVCRDLIEHLHHPEKFFEEASRCLVEGGGLIIKTPYLYGGVALAAKVFPRTLSEYMWRTCKGNTMPCYPFVYKANTVKALNRLTSSNGLVVESIQYINMVPHWFRRVPIITTALHALTQFAARIRENFLQSSMMVVLRKNSM